MGLEASSALSCENPPAASTYDYQGINVDVRGRVFEVRAYNFAFDASGNPVSVGSPAKRYSILDCFAFNYKGAPVAAEDSCRL
jgi:hypothetical protein